ncbi:MAG TPA: hypothetical protein VKA10_08450, partial [Prolixibacteraceae bacterium]|nr:hypothetical protein [Prolixibacteraceae bacterium]
VVKVQNLDTLIFYYNDSYQLVKPICATIFRISKIDTILGTFTGDFTDYYQDSTIAVKGSYIDGKKEGNFKLYFPNGQLEQVGKYVNNDKHGKWEYYYNDGTTHQTIDFKDKETLILEFWDENGNKMVESGNGKWFGYETPEKNTKIAGNVKNGKKDGKWKRTIPSKNMTVNIEKYEDGNFIKGKEYSIIYGSVSYKDTMYCLLEQSPAFITAELFEISRCYRMQNDNFEDAEYPGGMSAFHKEIQEKLVLTQPSPTRGKIVIHMTINKKGEMTNFKPISDIGCEYDVIRVFETMKNWIPMKVNGEPTIQPKLISFEIK